MDIIAYLYCDENRNRKGVERNTNLKYLINGVHHAVAHSPSPLVTSCHTPPLSRRRFKISGSSSQSNITCPYCRHQLYSRRRRLGPARPRRRAPVPWPPPPRSPLFSPGSAWAPPSKERDASPTRVRAALSPRLYLSVASLTAAAGADLQWKIQVQSTILKITNPSFITVLSWLHQKLLALESEICYYI